MPAALGGAVVFELLRLAHAVGLQPVYATFWPIGAVILAATAAWIYTDWRDMPLARASCGYFLASVLISLSVLIYSYVTLRALMPLADEWLAAADISFGISTPALVDIVDGSQFLSLVM